jgi:hypothetical protein
MNRYARPDAQRDRHVGRLGLLSRGTPIAAAFAVVGIGAVAAISYPGKSTAGNTVAGETATAANQAAATATPTSATGTNTTTQSGAATPTAATPTLAAPTAAPVSVGGGGHVSSGGS